MNRIKHAHTQIYNPSLLMHFLFLSQPHLALSPLLFSACSCLLFTHLTFLSLHTFYTLPLTSTLGNSPPPPLLQSPPVQVTVLTNTKKKQLRIPLLFTDLFC